MTVSAAIAAANWSADPIIAGTGWWPETTEGYSIGDNSVTGVYWHDNGDTPVITYTGVTQVADSDITNDYLFGYADVRAAGTYGSVVNPYASVPNSGSGGDGFDLSWAVDTDGEPVDVNNVKYVRVYSAVLHNAGIFGETSTEVCGIYVVNGSNGGAASAPTITANDMAFEDWGAFEVETTEVSDNQQIITVSGLASMDMTTFTLGVSGGTNVFINGVNTTDADITLGTGTTLVQIINQSGNGSPFVTLLKLSA